MTIRVHFIKRGSFTKKLKSHILDGGPAIEYSAHSVIMKFVKFPAMSIESVLTTYFIELGRALNDKMIETVLFKNTFLQNEHKHTVMVGKPMQGERRCA